jgi:RNA polymerase I-specific transcription initiation factor RRN7
MLQPDDLQNGVSELALMYHKAFGIALPPLNHEILLYKYVIRLALPLEVFPAVQQLARMARSDFSYMIAKGGRRQQASAFPELELISLLVVAVKLLNPFDGVSRRPRSIKEPTAQEMDWPSWQQRWELAHRPQDNALARGSEIDVRDTDVFDMSQKQLDSYMDWYQKTWVREPRSGAEDSVNKEILEMFPSVCFT